MSEASYARAAARVLAGRGTLRPVAPGTMNRRTRQTNRNVVLRAAVQGIRRAAGPMLLTQPTSRAHKEHKFFDVGGTTFVQINADQSTAVADSANGYLLQGAAATASAIVLNQVPVGTGPTNRIGRVMTMKNLHIRGVVQTGGDFVEFVAMYLVYIPRLDRNTTTMPPHNVITGAQDSRTQTVVQNAPRFKILKKWQWKLSGQANAASNTEASGQIFDDMVSLRSLPTRWTTADTTGSFNDMEEGALCLYAQNSQGNAAPIQFTTRIYFNDN